ncbi:MAG: RNA-binding protein [Candidatus Melainabacteria bacterium]|nr:RNA-binding protein [Candidatus Melainabacteria bacterium]
MSRRLIIGNLALDTDKSDLQKLFESLGRVSTIELVEDPRSGKQKGFAFVEFETRAEALKALGAAPSTELNGRLITINSCAQQQETTSLVARLIKMFRK